MLEVVDDFKTADSMEHLRSLRYTVSAFVQNPGMRLCRALADSYVRSEPAVVTVGETSWCMHPEYDDWSASVRNPQWGVDCKCNNTLQNLQCCVPSPAQRAVRQLSGLVPGLVEQQCEKPEVISQLLNDAVIAGDVSVTFREDDIWQKQDTVRKEQREFLEQCNQEMHDKVCSAPGDCLYGTVCETQHSEFKCRMRSQNRIEPYLQCYLHKMGADGPKQLFASRLGVNIDECPLWIGRLALPRHRIRAPSSRWVCEGLDAPPHPPPF